MTTLHESTATMLVSLVYNDDIPFKKKSIICDENYSSYSTPNTHDGQCGPLCDAYRGVCPCVERLVSQAVAKKVQSNVSDSKVFQEIPQFRYLTCNDITMGTKMGEGSYSIAQTCSLNDEPENCDLAIKYLKNTIMVDQHKLQSAAADLANEALFLGRLNHPNIVKLIAVSQQDIASKFQAGKEACCFLILERLEETLDERIARWRMQARGKSHSANLFHRMSKEFKGSQRALLKERLEAAIQIAESMQYMHENRIVFRDLKPKNIGIDKNGNLKLIDFGLAKELKACDENVDATYNISGGSGSRRYMAPEVALRKPYNESVDVYSFGIVLWEMCSMTTCFPDLSRKSHMANVIKGGKRPKTDGYQWPANLKTLMKKCWAGDPHKRPSFAATKETLLNILKELESGNSKKPITRRLAFELKTKHNQ